LHATSLFTGAIAAGIYAIGAVLIVVGSRFLGIAMGASRDLHRSGGLEADGARRRSQPLRAGAELTATRCCRTGL